jgi:hypothetical protein
VELNLCPSCNAFINASWETCVACGAALRPATAAYASEPADEAIEETMVPASTGTIVGGNETDGFTVRWDTPAAPPVETSWTPPVDSFETSETNTTAWTAPVEPVAVTTTGGWTAPESVAQNTEDSPVQISWPAPTPAASAPPAFESPSFYDTPTSQAAAHLQPEVELQTFHYDSSTFSGNAGVSEDGRLRPELSKGAILAFAGAGPAVLIVLILIVSFIGGVAKEEALVDIPQAVETPVTAAAPAPSSWNTYADPNGYFSASLPATPTVSNIKGPNGTAFSWISNSPDGQTQVAVVAAPLPAGDFRNNQQALKNSLSSAATASNMTVKGQIIDTENSTMHLDALLEGPNSSSNIRLFVADRTMFSLSIEGKDAAANAQAFDKLTKSFKALGGKPA